MQLNLKRGQLSEAYVLEVSFDFSGVERRAIAAKGLLNRPIYDSATLGEIELGKRFEFPDLASLIAAENTLRATATGLETYLAEGDDKKEPVEMPEYDQETYMDQELYIKRLWQAMGVLGGIILALAIWHLMSIIGK